MNSQLEMEMKFSKKFKDLLVIDDIINDLGSVMSAAYIEIDTWREQEFYPMKQKLVDSLPETQDIVIELMLTMVTKLHVHLIQGSAVELGSRLGFISTIEAAKIGSSIISLCHGDLYDITIEPDGTYLVPKLNIDAKLKRKINQLNFLPPNLTPIRWVHGNNTGGWLWEKKSIILGNGNHHDKPQAIDVLNKLQKIEWTIDLDVLVNEIHENPTHNETEIIGHYVGEKFYFTYRYDKRGRIYSSGYDINPQSDEYGKAILKPTKAEICTTEGIRALKIDVANYAGLDKLSWDERVSTIDSGKFKWKKPILGRKASRALVKANAGEPIAHFIELDATSSGFQIMACLSGCVTTGRTCNLVNTGMRENAYEHVHKAMEELVDCTDIETKYPAMTFFYGSKKVPREAFNDEQLAAFYEVIRTTLPGCNSIMELLPDYWNPNTLAHEFTMPDGHVVRCKSMVKKHTQIDNNELGNSFMLDHYENEPHNDHITIYSMIVHAVDAWVCREVIRRCNFDVVPIHDCWGCHPNYAEQLKQVYREVLYDLCKLNLLNDICSQLLGRDAGIVVSDEGLADEILNSEYALS